MATLKNSTLKETSSCLLFPLNFLGIFFNRKAVFLLKESLYERGWLEEPFFIGKDIPNSGTFTVTTPRFPFIGIRER